MPVVLDLAISAARDLRGDGRPTIVVAESHDVDDPALSDGEGALLEERVKLIPPSLAALFSSATADLDSQVLPRARTELNNAVKKFVVLRAVPGPSLLRFGYFHSVKFILNFFVVYFNGNLFLSSFK